MHKHHDSVREESEEKSVDIATDKWDAVFFIAIFLIVLYLLFPGLSSSIPKVYRCEDHNNDYEGCVAAQRKAKGCAWYSQCNACAKDGSDITKLCPTQ